jgi:geranylgeranyl reductase family protein
VLICDKATFPRDKPCGDGLTPRSVKWMTEMGLADELQARFHRVDTLRVVTDRRTMERRWPERPGLPDHGFVAARTELDELLLQCAADAGADVRQGTEVVEPLVEEGVVRGVMTRSPDGLEPLHARVTVAADGMSSRLGRSVGMAPRKDRPFGLAVRAQVESSRPDDAALECHATLRHNGRLLPAYGWIFPMGGGRLNVGVGYAATFRGWRAVNINRLMHQFLGSLPLDWRLPSATELLEQKQLDGWRLPMGLSVWPPWRPGLLAVGDAVGAIKPFTGVGISKAIESGVLAADCALDAADPADLAAYEAELHELWGGYYRLGRAFVRAVGRPRVMGAVVGTGITASITNDFFTRLFTGNGQFDPAGGPTARTLAGLEQIAARLPDAPEPPPQQRGNADSPALARLRAKGRVAGSPGDTTHHDRVRRYYEGSWMDYRMLWLNRRNRAMHFGYAQPGERRHASSLVALNHVMAEAIGLKRREVVLDAGCGVGGTTMWLAETYQAEATGVNIVQSQVERARRYSRERGLFDLVRFAEGDYACTGLPSESFDVVWAQESACHAPVKAAFLDEAFRLLRPNGRIVLAEYLRCTEQPASRDYADWVDGHELALCSASGWQEALDASGFSGVEIRDLSPHMERSMRRLHRLCVALYPVDLFLHRFGIRNGAQHANIRAGRAQWRSYQADEWRYGLIVATKPDETHETVHRRTPVSLGAPGGYA